MKPYSNARGSKPVFDYSDFREFLREALLARRQGLGMAWSMRAIARRIGLRGPAMLSMIIKGKRMPGDDLAARLAQELGLSSAEQGYFLDLVELERVRGDSRRTDLVIHRLSARIPGAVATPSPLWHRYALRELIRLPTFRDDIDWIARVLEFQLSPSEVRRTLDEMIRIGTLTRDANGRLQLTQEGALIEHESAPARQLHEEALSHALTVIRSSTAADLFGTTVAIPKDKLGEAKALIQKFQNDFSIAMEKGNCDSVYHLEMVLFPLARGGGEENT